VRGTSWPGLVPVLHRLILGSARSPKAKRYHETTTPTTSVYYEGMHGDYRWFRQDELVRRCVLVNAFFATMAVGFETVLEAARYRDEKAGYDAYIIRQWLEPKLVLSDAIRELTGVHA
jgi:hypothetical protein